jgi:hypothetical protein
LSSSSLWRAVDYCVATTTTYAAAVKFEIESGDEWVTCVTQIWNRLKKKQRKGD